MLTKTLSEAKKKQRNILIKALNNDIGSIDSAKDSWNPAQISERTKDISYIRSLVDTWNPAQLNEALKMLDLPVIDTWNPAQIEEQRRNLVFYLTERTLNGNPITLKILGNLTPEVTGLKVTMNPIQDLHGQSSPYPAGGGKNKLRTTLTSGTYGGIQYVVDDLGKIKLNSTPATANSFSIGKANLESGIGYKLSGGVDADFRMYIYINGTAYTSSGGDSDVFTPSTSGEYEVVLVTAVNATVGDTVSPMIRLSTVTDATFAPYSNICPISGRTEVSVTRTAGEDVETKTHQYSETIYGGVDDFVNGGLTNEWGYIASYDGETLPGEWISDRDVYEPNTSPTTGAEVAYKLSTPTTVETTAEELTLLKGTNVLSTDGDSIELKYKQNF